jgi:hypothetical protein
MKVKHTLIAFALVLALGGAFYYLDKLPEKPAEDAIPKEALFSFTADQIAEFTLQSASQPAATFRRIGDAPAPAKEESGTAAEAGGENKDAAQWEIVSPEGIAADSSQIEFFLEEIVGMQGSPLVTEAPPEWSEYGLEAPEKSYQFKLKDGKTVEFSIGVANPAGYARYARRDNAPPILLIDDIDNKALIEKALFDLRDKRILPVKAEEAQRIELRFDLGGAQPSAEELAKARQLGLPVKASRIVMTKQPNSNWQLDEPLRRTDYGATNYLFSTLSGGTLRSIEEEKGTSLAKYGLDNPQIRVNVTTSSGSHSLLVGDQITRGEEQLFYARNTVWPHVFTILRTAYDQLNQDLESYRERYLYDFDQINARSLEIEGPLGRMHFALRGEEWFMAGSPEKKMDDLKMSNFLNSIHSLRIATYTTDEPNRFAAYGLDQPWMTTKVTFSEQNREETVIYARKNGKFYAARVGEPSVYELSEHEPDNLLTKIRELIGEPAPEDQSPSSAAAPATQ